MSKQWNESTATAKGLYDPRYEHDNFGIGAVVNIKGIKTYEKSEAGCRHRLPSYHQRLFRLCALSSQQSLKHSRLSHVF